MSDESITKAQFVVNIDNSCADIYHRYSRFILEYQLREAQAIAFLTPGFVGATPRQIRAFSERAGITDTAAATLILQQAAQLRELLEVVGETRMRKYEVTRAATIGDAQIAYVAIMQTIKAIEASLP